MIKKERREYQLELTLNGRAFSRVVIDPHYEVRHSGSISDDLILELIKLQDGEEHEIEAVLSSGFEIVRINAIYWDGRYYRLILTLPPLDGEDPDFLGVINAFRVHQRNRKEKS